IALIVPGLLVGGCERHVVKLARALHARGVYVCVIVLQGRLARPLASGLPSGVPLLATHFHRRDPRLIAWLGRKLHEQRIDVAHSFLWYGDTIAALACALFSRVPLIASERGDRGSVYYSRTRHLLDRLLTFRVARRVCANSRFGAELLASLGCPAGKVRVISNGIDLAEMDQAPSLDLRREFGIPVSAPTVGVVSRLVWYKAVDLIVRAFTRLAPELGAHLLIVGDGPQRAELEALVARGGIGDRVHFAGVRAGAEVAMRDVNVAALATRTTEHCSNSILEYMACARPVVATRSAGTPELVTDGSTGLLIDVDDEAALVAALTRLLTEPHEARAMGLAGRQWIADEATMDRVADRFVALCHEAAREQAPRG
ncbi:MAG: glycosyltransferase family 4 protein, partial [Gemmatimonadales bacterium]|nr:glycosyltransferase family 4 protein [Gemmatimonadales bacterium]